MKIKEGDKERIQVFEGTIIAKKHGGIAETFTVRRISHGCGVERVFPVHSPNVAKVEIVRSGRVRRAKFSICAIELEKPPKSKKFAKQKSCPYGQLFFVSKRFAKKQTFPLVLLGGMPVFLFLFGETEISLFPASSF